MHGGSGDNVAITAPRSKRPRREVRVKGVGDCQSSFLDWGKGGALTLQILILKKLEGGAIRRPLGVSRGLLGDSRRDLEKKRGSRKQGFKFHWYIPGNLTREGFGLGARLVREEKGRRT